MDVSNNVYLFKFVAERDRKRVIELGPWNIEGFPLNCGFKFIIYL